MPDHDAQALWVRARQGERAAFDRLQETLAPLAARFARHLIGWSDAEQEIVQEAFLALYLNLERLASIDDVRPFLFRVIRNRCYGELRRRGRFERVSLDDDFDRHEAAHDPRVYAPPLDEEVIDALLRSEVRAAIDDLPEPQRQAMILYCYEEMSYAAIAQALCCEIGTVKSRIHYGRRKLMKRIGPTGTASLRLPPGPSEAES